MNKEILISLLLLTAMSMVSGVLVSPHPVRGRPKFDERQMIEQGKAAQLSMNTGLSYLLFADVAFTFDLIRMENMMIVMVFGLLLITMIYRGYCIFHDAYEDPEENSNFRTVMDLVCGIIWLAMAFSRLRFSAESFWINLILGISCAFEGVCLLTRKLYLGWKNQHTDED